MNTMGDNTIEAFFALVRTGLWGSRSLDIRIDGTTVWNNIYRLAQEQSVQGVVLLGIEELRAKNIELNVPQVLLLQWIGEVQIIEQRNKEMNAFVAELIERLRKENIYALLVKGQGVAQCYEKPLWRSSGDVDLLLSKENYEKAKTFIQRMGVLTEPEESGKKHLAMQIEQWTVELHGTLHVGLSARVDRMLDNVQNDIFYRGEVRSVVFDVNASDNETTKCYKNVQVFLPAANEDVVYVFAHILQHFYKGGIGLRQICDWCRLLWTYRESLNYVYLESKIREAGLMSEWKAFATLAVEYLGMPVEAMPFLDVRGMKEDGRCEIDKRLRRKADRIMEFVLKSGNMGYNRDMSYFSKYPYLIRKCVSMGRRINDLINHAKIFPLDSLRFFPYIMFNGLRSAMRGE